MTLCDFLSRIKAGKSNPSEIIFISFGLQEVLWENIIFAKDLEYREWRLL